jgi:hypothetical protein
MDRHHPIVTMQCGPVRDRVNARAEAAARPFEQVVLVQPTGFRSRRAPNPDRRVEFLFLTLPVSWCGTVAQYAGRHHQLHDSKHEVRVHDYADIDVPMAAGERALAVAGPWGAALAVDAKDEAAVRWYERFGALRLLDHSLGLLLPPATIAAALNGTRKSSG